MSRPSRPMAESCAIRMPPRLFRATVLCVGWTACVGHRVAMTPYTWAEKFERFVRKNSMRETNGNFDSCNSCKRLVPSRLHELHASKFPFVSRIEFFRSKLSNFSAHAYGVSVWARSAPVISVYVRSYPAGRHFLSGPGSGTWLTADHLVKRRRRVITPRRRPGDGGLGTTAVSDAECC